MIFNLPYHSDIIIRWIKNMEKDKKIKLVYKHFNLLIASISDIYESYLDDFDDIKRILIRKIFSNVDAVRVLVEIECFNEAKIIIRSMIETTVLFVYYSMHPEQRNVLLNEANIIRFKNAFGRYCLFRDTPYSLKKQQASDTGYASIDDLSQSYLSELEKCYAGLSEENRKHLLKIIIQDVFLLNKDSIEKIEKYFKHKFRPIMLSLSQLFDGLGDNGVIVEENEVLTIRSGVYEEYNDFSQIAHGNIGHWMNNSDDYRIFSTIIRLLFIMLSYSKDIIPQDVITDKLQDKINEYNKSYD